MNNKSKNESSSRASRNWDLIVVGSGLAGLVAAYEAAKAGCQVLVVEQENTNNLGGQAFWSLGGLFFVDSPEQRRLGIKDSYELARADWQQSAQFDRPEDYWPRKWADAYVRFAAGDKRAYLKELGLNTVPVVGWAERGSGDASGHGNSVPRFHLTWGTGPEVVRIFREAIEEINHASSNSHANAQPETTDRVPGNGFVEFRFRHRVDKLHSEQHTGEHNHPHTPHRITGVSGSILTPCDDLPRGVASPRTETGETFTFRGRNVLVATGGVGGNLDLVRQYWPAERLGEMPEDMVCGVPAHVDGRGIEIAEAAGAHVINRDRMWHYTEGMANWNPVWPGHGIRIIPGPSSLWVDATGTRLPTNLLPGADTVATIKHILSTGYTYSWFILNAKIAGKEFLFSGSEQNPDLTEKKLTKLVGKITADIPAPVRAFMDHGEDWVVAKSVAELAAGMNRTVAEVPGAPTIDPAQLQQVIEDRDRQTANAYSKDYQVNYIHTARNYVGDKVIRTVPPAPLLADDDGPLIAVRLRMLTRKTLGGIETNLDSQVMDAGGNVIGGLYAAGEAAGFGGGGVHGNNALEGTFLGGCIYSGRQAGRAVARDVAGEEN